MTTAATPHRILASPQLAPHTPSQKGRRRASPTRRDEIIGGATDLFMEYGYYGASLREIARHIDISHPGMLHHFPSKAALLDGVIDPLEDSAQETLDQIEQLCAKSDILVDSLVALYDPSMPSLKLMAKLCSEAVGSDYPARYRIARLRRVHEHILQHCIEHLAKHGRCRPELDPGLAARTGMSVILGHAAREETVRRMQRTHHRDEPANDLRQFLGLILSPSD